MAMLCEDPDAMEFEYTHPQMHATFNSSSFLNSQPCFQKQNPFIPKQFLSKSLFDTKETLATDSVCNLLDSFNLDEKEEKIQTPVSPKTPLPETNKEEVAPIIATGPKEPTTFHQHHAYNHHTPTFIYNQAPIPAIDPLAEKHSTIHYIMGLIKIGFTTITFSALLYFFVQFIQFVRYDVATKIAEYESNEFNEQIHCQREYKINQCSPGTSLPALANLCQELENCIFRPFSISKSRVLAETLAEIANGFSDNITLKTACLSIITAIGIMWSITSVLTRPKDNTKTKIENTYNKRLLLK